MKQLLVIADPIEQNQLAFHKAVDFANKSGAAIRVLVFLYEALKDICDDELEANAIKQQLIDNRSAWWQQYVSEHASSDLAIQINIVWQKDIHLWIIEHTNTTPYDLVIKTGHRSEALFYTPTDWHLFRDCHAPVYIVNQEKIPKKKVILACLDLATQTEEKQQLNHSILEAAFRLSVQVGGQLHCCHVVKIPKIIRELELVDTKARFHREEESAMQHFAPMADEYEISGDNIHILEGEPAHNIPSLVRKLKIDCVVIGSIGRKGISGKLVGNTAEKVLRNLASDLLVINHQC